MKISIYKLLGLIKDGKAPKKIKYCGCIYEWEEDWYLTKEKNCRVCLGGKKEDINQLYNAFNDNVEILEEVEDKEYEDIEEVEVYHQYDTALIKNYDSEFIVNLGVELLADKINVLIRNQQKIIKQLENK